MMNYHLYFPCYGKSLIKVRIINIRIIGEKKMMWLISAETVVCLVFNTSYFRAFVVVVVYKISIFWRRILPNISLSFSCTQYKKEFSLRFSGSLLPRSVCHLLSRKLYQIAEENSKSCPLSL